MAGQETRGKIVGRRRTKSIGERERKNQYYASELCHAGSKFGGGLPVPHSLLRSWDDISNNHPAQGSFAMVDFGVLSSAVLISNMQRGAHDPRVPFFGPLHSLSENSLNCSLSSSLPICFFLAYWFFLSRSPIPLVRLLPTILPLVS